MNNEFYWLCRKIYARVCDLIEEENNIKIEYTKNAEIFYQEMKELINKVGD